MMQSFFFDSSALVKRYIPEQSTHWVRRVTRSYSRSEIVISELALVEMTSAVARRTREGFFSTEVAAMIVRGIMSHASSRYYVFRVDAEVIAKAQSLCLQHPLRSLDAIQLASAIIVNQGIARGGLPPLTFVCADTRLLTVAAVEGMTPLDPNTMT